MNKALHLLHDWLKNVALEMPELLENMLVFFGKGGPVLLGIFFVSFFMWILIMERYWFLYHIYPRKLEAITSQWQRRLEQDSWYSYKIREGLLTELSVDLKRNLIPIKTMTAVLPLLGLLGTVTGMISIFDVLNVFGTSNARGMAEGISRALLPTTAGLVTSIIGIYLASDLDKRARTHELLAKDHLTH